MHRFLEIALVGLASAVDPIERRIVEVERRCGGPG
jgi:hypothetical protein